MLKAIHVINLDENRDRLETISRSFKEYNLEFNRFPGILGKKLSQEELNEKASLLCNNILCTKGMIGCALSHIQLWKKLINDVNNEYYIIMEDDAKITELFIPTVEELEKNHLDFDLLFLRCLSSVNCSHKNVIKKLSNNVIVGESYFPLTLACYIISKRGAKKLIPLFEKVEYHIDVLLAIKQYSDNIKILTTSPNIIELSSESDKSTLHEKSIKSPTLNIINRINSKMYWYLTIPLLCIKTKIVINSFLVFLVLLFFVNYKYIKSKILYLYLVIELFIYFFM